MVTAFVVPTNLVTLRRHSGVARRATWPGPQVRRSAHRLTWIIHTPQRVGGRMQHPRRMMGRGLFMELIVHPARDPG